MNDSTEAPEELTIRPEAKLSLVPRDLTEAMTYAKMISASSMCPPAFRNKPNDALVAIQYGLELVGCSPLQALQNIAVINGRPSMWGDLVLAVVRRSGQMEWIKERDAQEAWQQKEGHCEVQRKGEPEPVTRTFSYEMATDAGLVKRSGSTGPWGSYPGRMLQMRARSWALRDTFTDVLMGMQLREEVEDMVQINETTQIITPRRKSDPAPADVDAFIDNGPAVATPQRASATAGIASTEELWSGALTGVQVKEGTSKGRKWKLYELAGSDGATFGTFSATVMDTAQGFIDTGEEVDVRYTMTAKGSRNITSIEAAIPSTVVAE